jgi:hypothetical protein
VFERLTDESRQVLVAALEEARLLDHRFIGTEHILLGLIRADGSIAAQVLAELGAELPAVRERVAETIGPPGGPATGSPPFTPRAKRVLELALRELIQSGGEHIGPEYILLGLIREGEGVGAQILTSLGIGFTDVRRQIMERLDEVQGDPTTNAPIRRRGRTGGEGAQAQMVTCSFCGLSPPESGQLVSGDNAFICENCIRRWSGRLGTGTPSAGHSRVSKASPNAPTTGFEPEGAEASRAEIKRAFLASRVLSDDGRSVPAVEHGDDLGPTLNLANDRHGGIVADGSSVRISADEIRFSDRERAVVWFSIWTGDRRLLERQRGEAVHVDGEWKMARSTFCRLMRMAGVACPPESA